MIEITAWDNENPDTENERFAFRLPMGYDSPEVDIVDAVEREIYRLLHRGVEEQAPPWSKEGSGNVPVLWTELVDYYTPGPDIWRYPQSADAQGTKIVTSRIKVLICNNYGITNWIVVRDLGVDDDTHSRKV